MVGADQFAVLHLGESMAPMVDDERVCTRDGYAWRVLHDFRIAATGDYGIFRGGP